MPRSCWIDHASWVAGAALVIGAGSAGVAQTPAQTAVREGIARNIYITATDDKGAAPRDLTPEEVTVKEDGTARTVLDVRPATEPMQVVLLIDDSGRPTDSIHEALDETIARSTVFAEATRRSGGRLEQVGQATGIPKRLSEIAYELRDQQLVVTYARPQSSKPAEKIEVTVKRRGLRVRAPKWVG
jgi:hypothetical protein